MTIGSLDLFVRIIGGRASGKKTPTQKVVSGALKLPNGFAS
jgi:hypothetical protein